MTNDLKLYRELGRRLKALREDEANHGVNKKTQAELAQAIGLERTSITNIEKGTQKLPLHVLYRICEVFGKEVSEVLPSLTELRRSSDNLPMEEVELGGTKVAPASIARFVVGL